MKIAVGIDLGTTNSVLAYMENGQLKFVRFQGVESLSSVIFIDDKNNISVGRQAKNRAVTKPENFIKSSKAFMGDNNKYWNINNKKYSPTDVATEILKAFVKALNKDGFTEIEAVITVPAYFKSNQIEETKKAGEKAGLIVKQIITEPMSAAVAYAFDDKVNQKLFVFDIGGGTFDVSVLEVKDKNYNTIMIDGDAKLGGDDFDQIIYEHFLSHIRRNKAINLSTFDKSGLSQDEYNKAVYSLLNQAEEAKKALSESLSFDVEIPNLFGNYSFQLTLNRADFENISNQIFNKIERIVDRSLNKNSINKNDIDKIILVGGTAKIPKIQEFVTNYFGKTPYSDKPLDTLVAMGAAIVASNDNTMQVKINDIISHSLGIELINDKFSPILKKNQHYPISYTETYTTTSNYQKFIDINVFEGEDLDNVNNNDFYGGFALTNIEHATRGVPKIEVTFEFDKNRILKVTARDIRTNSTKSEKIEIDKGSRKKITPVVESFDIVVMIDVSGSMCGYPLEKAQQACSYLVSNLIDLNVHKLALVEFESSAVILSNFTNDKNQILSAINRLSCRGGT